MCPIVAIESADFRVGFVEGLTDCQDIPRFELEPTEEAILLIMRNMVEMFADGDLTEGLLQHDTGLIVGLVTRFVYQPH